MAVIVRRLIARMAPIARGTARWKVGLVKAMEKLMKIDWAADGIVSITDSFLMIFPWTETYIGRSLLIPIVVWLVIIQKTAKVELRIPVFARAGRLTITGYGFARENLLP